MSQVFQRCSVDSPTHTTHIFGIFTLLVEAVKRAIFGVYLPWLSVYGKMLFVWIKRVVSSESLAGCAYAAADSHNIPVFLFPFQSQILTRQMDPNEINAENACIRLYKIRSKFF